MELFEFPSAIAQNEIALSSQKKEIQECQDILDALNNEIERQVAFDADLKNDPQRKVRRFDLMQSEEYVKSATRLRNLQNGMTHVEIAARSLLNQFAVAKLEQREKIALLDYNSDSAVPFSAAGK
jgi:hypothetical protein